MMLGLALYPISDALIKHLMEMYGLFQSTFLRAFTRLVPLFLATFFQGGPRAVFGARRPYAHMVRLAGSLMYTYIFMYAYSKESLTVGYTLSYTSPFFLIVLSGLILKERISKERWIAVVIGAVGILVAIRPGLAPFEMTVLLVLFGVFLGTLNKIFMRKLAITEHGLAIIIYPNLLLIAATLPFLIGSWQEIPWSHWGLFSVVGILSAAGQYAIAQSLRYTEVSILAPVDNSTFFWVVLLDFWGCGLVPDTCTIIGVAIIIGSNLYLLRTQHRTILV